MIQVAVTRPAVLKRFESVDCTIITDDRGANSGGLFIPGSACIEFSNADGDEAVGRRLFIKKGSEVVATFEPGEWYHTVRTNQ